MYATQYTPEQIRAYLIAEGIVDGNNGHIWDADRFYDAAVANRVSARQIDAAMIGFSPGWEWGTTGQWILANGRAPLLTDPPFTPPPVVSPPVGVVTPAPVAPKPGPAPGFPPLPPDFSVVPVVPAPRPPVVTVPGTAPPVQAGPPPAVPPLTAPGGPGTVPGPIPGTPEAGAPAGPGALTLLAIAAAAAFLA